MSDAVAVHKNGTLPARQYARRAISPPVDVFENADEFLLVADVPGALTESIDVRVENGTLTLEAKRTGDDGGPVLAREFDAVDYTRTFQLPAGIDATNIAAETKSGTLLVRLPKVAAVKPRKIVVRGG
jgi:HSP20 family molecular chaperone IbpA